MENEQQYFIRVDNDIREKHGLSLTIDFTSASFEFENDGQVFMTLTSNEEPPQEYKIPADEVSVFMTKMEPQ